MNAPQHDPALAYDRVPYLGTVFPQTHPDRLATLAWLHGLDPAPVARCRVLDVGCSDGSNLLPMALNLPESTFVGIDVADEAIARGAAQAEAFGARNLTLRTLDLMDFEAEAPFDYVIAHGFYAWVPPDIRERLLALCAEALALHGVAYVSYSTLPGGYLRRMMREMMQFHVRGLSDPRQQARQARALLSWLHQAQPEPSFYQAVLAKELDLIGQYADEHLIHDQLASVNEPVFFYQFVEHAGRHGLRYLSESTLAASRVRGFGPEVAQTLEQLGRDPIALEQYLDFLRCRMFRQTLLCRQDAPLEAPAPERVEALFASASFQPDPATSDAPEGAVTLVDDEGRTLTTGHPLTQTVLAYLGAQWPRYVPFAEIQEAVQRAPDPHLLPTLLLSLYADGFIGLHRHAPQVANTVSARPAAMPLARQQAERAQPVANQHHAPVWLDEEDARLLVPLLDGTRTHADLLADWNARRAASGDDRPALIQEDLDQTLGELVRQALLVA